MRIFILAALCAAPIFATDPMEEAFHRLYNFNFPAAHELLDALVTAAPPRDREVEAAKARERAADRFRSSEPRRGA